MIRLTREKKKTILGFMLIGVIMLQGKRAYIILPLFVQKTSTVHIHSNDLFTNRSYMHLLDIKK